MNTYTKFCPNVFVAKCNEKHEKSEEIILTTKYGKEHKCIIHNFLGSTTDGFYLYSITRADGFNAQEWAKNKAERLNGHASNAEKRSNEAFKKADLSEKTTGIPFGQPILVGHHSESKHRKVLERAENAMRKSIEESNKSEQYRNRAEYWEKKANTINLSMPESLEYFEYKLKQVRSKHQDLKDNPQKRAHSMSLQYANKEVKETEKNLQLAIKLWGNENQVAKVNEEKKVKAEKKAKKGNKMDALLDDLGHFFAFSTDQFKEGYKRLVDNGFIEQGEKVSHIKAGLYIPSKNVKQFYNELLEPKVKKVELTQYPSKRRIFKKAWQLAAEGANKFGGSKKEYFAEALRIVYQEYKFKQAA